MLPTSSGFAYVYDIKSNNSLNQTKTFISVNDYKPSTSSNWVGLYSDMYGGSVQFTKSSGSILSQINNVNISNSTISYTYKGYYGDANLLIVFYD